MFGWTGRAALRASAEGRTREVLREVGCQGSVGDRLVGRRGCECLSVGNSMGACQEAGRALVSLRRGGHSPEQQQIG